MWRWITTSTVQAPAVSCCHCQEGMCVVMRFSTEENGFNPVWNEGCDFDINNPSLALLRFTVLDEDAFGDANFLGQAVFPVQCLRTGYRSVPLKNAFSEELELCSLLVHLEMRSAVEEGEELYCTIRSLREDITRMSKQFQHMVRDDPTNGSDQLAEIIQEKQLQLRKLNSARQVVTQGGLLSRWSRGLCVCVLFVFTQSPEARARKSRPLTHHYPAIGESFLQTICSFFFSFRILFVEIYFL